ncbi:MAG: hypothetical protein HQL05_03510 [Nitrospirae bacterium]|uniref:hypothetical protein n=1 Tax=Candidatus Magnetobacterium casense TaxID=1455061 RepID=UPI00058F7613|nr:hypothetical protein [Candidatus Magnetobacterium casensis]MBF0336876.1 hypothetical protein [Nitrospirota bacterium]
MVTLKEIEKAITDLSEDDFARLRDWIEELDAEIWDRQFEQDVRSGRLKDISEVAVSDFKRGNYREI